MKSKNHTMPGCMLILLWALLPLTGCIPAEVLAPRLNWPNNEPWKKRWVQAPIIVVGRATSVSVGRRSSMRRSDWSIDVRLQEINVDVENVIRGRICEKNIRVYRYGYFSGHLPGNIPMDNILPDERRVFFLLPCGRNYRLIEDVVAGSLPVASGRHSHLPRDKPVYEQIAEVLILPGEDFDEATYARHLDVQISSTVPALIGFQRTVLLLRDLRSQAPKLVSAQACLALYKYYPFGDSCIEGLLTDSGTSRTMHEQALETVKFYGGGKAKEREQFKKNPRAWLDAWVNNQKLLSYVVSTSQEDVRFVLGEISERIDDPLIQRNSKMLLRDYVPQD